MRKRTQFVRDLFSDGYQIVGAIAPLLSILFTVAKLFEWPDQAIKDVSYAWALLPLLGWVLVAYFRRRKRSVNLEKALEPKIVLSDPCIIDSYSNSNQTPSKRCVLRITNKGSQLLQSCNAKAISSEIISMEISGVAFPADIVTQEQFNNNLSGPFHLRPGQHKELLLAEMLANSTIFHLFLGGIPVLPLGGDAVIDVAVYSEAPATQSIQIKIYESGGELFSEVVKANGAR